jgi:hypothetical protein
MFALRSQSPLTSGPQFVTLTVWMSRFDTPRIQNSKFKIKTQKSFCAAHEIRVNAYITPLSLAPSGNSAA